MMVATLVPFLILATADVEDVDDDGDDDDVDGDDDDDGGDDDDEGEVVDACDDGCNDESDELVRDEGGMVLMRV